MYRSVTSASTKGQNAEVQLSWVPAAQTLGAAYTKYLTYLTYLKEVELRYFPIVELGHGAARHALMFLNLELGLFGCQISIISLKLFTDKMFEEGKKKKKNKKKNKKQKTKKLLKLLKQKKHKKLKKRHKSKVQKH